MNNPKEIVEKIIKKGDNVTFRDWEIFCINSAIDLARAYLELEKKLETEFKLRKSAEDTAKDFGLEITKLKEENKELKGLADFDAFSRENFNSINAKQSSEIFKLKAENEKLKLIVCFLM